MKAKGIEIGEELGWGDLGVQESHRPHHSRISTVTVFLASILSSRGLITSHSFRAILVY